MRIIDIREKTVRLNTSMSNAAISFDDMTASVVAVVSDVVRDGKQVVGFGFDSLGRYAHGSLLMERFAPRVLAAEPDSLLDADGLNIDPVAVWATATRNEKPGGHGERAGAVGLLDTALWDLVAKLDNKPLWRVLAELYGDGRGSEGGTVPVYGSGGHYHAEGGVERLAEELTSMRDMGYTRLKIKGGGVPIDEDRRRIEAALEVVGTSDNLAVDLNGTFDAARAEGFLDAVAPYGLAWIEEVVDPLDFELQRQVCESYAGAIGTGENLASLADATNLIRYAGLRPDRDLLQFDVALAYGVVEYVRILDMLKANGWKRGRCYPHAGHLLSLHAVAGFGLGCHESAPDDSKIFGGYPDGCQVADGRVSLPDAPGIGYELKPNLWAVMRELVA